MASEGTKDKVKEMAAMAGVEINGSNPWDMKVNDDRLYQRILSQGSVGLGEAYMDGWWDTESVDQFIHKALSADLEEIVRKNKLVLFAVLKARLFNPHKKVNNISTCDKIFRCT